MAGCVFGERRAQAYCVSGWSYREWSSVVEHAAIVVRERSKSGIRSNFFIFRVVFRYLLISVFFIAYRFIPLCSTQMNFCIDSYMRESAVGSRSVPMHHICRNSDYIAGIQHLYRLPLFLIVTFSGGGNQNLSARMRMPAVSGFGSNITSETTTSNVSLSVISRWRYAVPLKLLPSMASPWGKREADAFGGVSILFSGFGLQAPSVAASRNK